MYQNTQKAMRIHEVQRWENCVHAPKLKPSVGLAPLKVGSTVAKDGSDDMARVAHRARREASTEAARRELERSIT